MGVFAFESFDEIGELRGNRAGLSAILPGLGRQRFKATVAIAERAIQ
jgi:hypothetical protein